MTHPTTSAIHQHRPVPLLNLHHLPRNAKRQLQAHRYLSYLPTWTATLSCVLVTARRMKWCFKCCMKTCPQIFSRQPQLERSRLWQSGILNRLGTFKRCWKKFHLCDKSSKIYLLKKRPHNASSSLSLLTTASSSISTIPP